jgi:hypothetical protein
VKEIARMRLGVLRELKNVHKFLNHMELGVKRRDPNAIQRAYMFLKTLVIAMNEGELTPENVALNLEIQKAFMEREEDL